MATIHPHEPGPPPTRRQATHDPGAPWPVSKLSRSPSRFKPANSTGPFGRDRPGSIAGHLTLPAPPSRRQRNGRAARSLPGHTTRHPIPACADDPARGSGQHHEAADESGGTVDDALDFGTRTDSRRSRPLLCGSRLLDHRRRTTKPPHRCRCAPAVRLRQQARDGCHRGCGRGNAIFSLHRGDLPITIQYPVSCPPRSARRGRVRHPSWRAAGPS